MTPPALLDSPWLTNLFIASLVILLERVLAIPRKAHPLSFMQILARKMADKVCRANNPAAQQRIAGLLAPAVMIIPWLIIIAIVRSLSEFPLFFDLLLLFVALAYGDVERSAKRCQLALQQNKKSLARQYLKNIVLRDVDSLSETGMSKACIEGQILRLVQQHITPLLLFMFFGGVSAFAYRWVLECHYQWNPKVRQYQHFGRPLERVIAVLIFLPLRLTTGIFALIGSPFKGIWIWLKGLQLTNRNHLLQSAALMLRVQLGGPVIYQQQKVRMTRFGRRLPNPGDISRSLLFVRLSTLLLLVLCALVGMLFIKGMTS